MPIPTVECAGASDLATTEYRSVPWQLATAWPAIGVLLFATAAVAVWLFPRLDPIAGRVLGLALLAVLVAIVVGFLLLWIRRLGAAPEPRVGIVPEGVEALAWRSHHRKLFARVRVLRVFFAFVRVWGFLIVLFYALVRLPIGARVRATARALGGSVRWGLSHALRWVEAWWHGPSMFHVGTGVHQHWVLSASKGELRVMLVATHAPGGEEGDSTYRTEIFVVRPGAPDSAPSRDVFDVASAHGFGAEASSAGVRFWRNDLSGLMPEPVTQLVDAAAAVLHPRVDYRSST